MATFIKTELGRWKVQLPRNAGRKSKTFDTKMQARSWARAMEEETEQASTGVHAHRQLAELFERYSGSVGLLQSNGRSLEKRR